MTDTEQPLRLYLVELTYRVAVLARSERAANRIAERNAGEYTGDGVDTDTFATVVVPGASSALGEWASESPYADTEADNPTWLTCAQILAGGLATEPTPPTERDMEAHGQLNVLGAGPEPTK